MKLRLAAGFVPLFGLLITAIPLSSVLAQTTIRAEHDEPVESITHRLMVQAAAEIATATNGKVKMDVHPGVSLSGGKIPTMIQNTQSGNVDLAIITTGVYSSVDPRTGVLSLPFMFGSIDEMARAARQSHVLDKLMAEQESRNLIVVDLWVRALRQLANTKREIRTPDDAKGLRFRVPEFKLWIDAFKAIGAVPVPMPFSEIPTALQLGTIDGAERPSEFLMTEKWWELAKFVTMANYSGDALMVAFNKGFWNKLDAGQQKIIVAKLKEVGDKKLVEEKNVENSVVETLRKNGVKVTVLTPAEVQRFRDAMKSVWTDNESRIGKDLMAAVAKAATTK
jgi:tripartite ATP-independent transporter DctP family solute receptor